MKRLLVTLIILLGLAAIPLQSLIAQGGVTGYANVRISNFLRLQPRTTITVTNGATVNPTGSYTRLTSAGGVGASLTVKPAGSVITLVNVGAQTITFTETATLISAGNVVLGAKDTASFVSDGTAWYEISASNN